MRCLQIVTPGQNFLAEMLELAIVLDAHEAAIAEHTLSILGSSYLEMGGLNTQLAGNQTMVTVAMKAPSELWENAARIQHHHQKRLRDLRHKIVHEKRHRKAKEYQRRIVKLGGKVQGLNPKRIDEMKGL